MTTMFSNYTDEQVLSMLARQRAVCERVMAMPEAERAAPGPKGEASPEQAGSLNAMFAMQAQAEAEARGLLPT